MDDELSGEQQLEAELLQDQKKRWMVVSLAFFSIVITGLYFIFFKPDNGLKKPLEVLNYEAAAMEDDDTKSRLYLPSIDPLEITDYLAETKNFGFIGRGLSEQEDWRPDGASIIDYETLKIAVVQYTSKKASEKLFMFTLPASLKDLKRSDVGEVNSRIYQAYANERFNIVAWQDTPHTLGVLIGRMSITDLAKLGLN